VSPDELDRDALRMVHAELTARIAGDLLAGHPPVILVVAMDETRIFADPACRQQLDDIIRLGRAENIRVHATGAAP
jgi:hypothetical protein